MCLCWLCYASLDMATVKFLKQAVVGMLECMDGTFLLHFKYKNKVIITEINKSYFYVDQN